MFTILPQNASKTLIQCSTIAIPTTNQLMYVCAIVLSISIGLRSHGNETSHAYIACLLVKT